MNKPSKLIEVRKRPADNEEIEAKRFKDDDCIDLTGYEDFVDLKSVKCKSNEGNEAKEVNKSQPNFSRLGKQKKYLQWKFILAVELIEFLKYTISSCQYMFDRYIIMKL